jgi:hypothetical protein
VSQKLVTRREPEPRVVVVDVQKEGSKVGESSQRTEIPGKQIASDGHFEDAETQVLQRGARLGDENLFIFGYLVSKETYRIFPNYRPWVLIFTSYIKTQNQNEFQVLSKKCF